MKRRLLSAGLATILTSGCAAGAYQYSAHKLGCKSIAHAEVDSNRNLNVDYFGYDNWHVFRRVVPECFSDAKTYVDKCHVAVTCTQYDGGSARYDFDLNQPLAVINPRFHAKTKGSRGTPGIVRFFKKLAEFKKNKKKGGILSDEKEEEVTFEDE